MFSSVRNGISRAKFGAYRSVISLILALFLSSCHSSGKSHYQSIRAGHKEHDHHRVIYKAQNSLRAIELEFTPDQLYLNVYAFSIPPYKEDPKLARLVITRSERQMTLTAERLEGGQRLRLPPTAAKALMETITSTSHFTVHLDGGYHITVETALLKDQLKKLEREARPFLSRRLIHLAL